MRLLSILCLLAAVARGADAPPAGVGDSVRIPSQGSLCAVAGRADRLAVVPENAPTSVEIWDSSNLTRVQASPSEGDGKVRSLAISDDGQTVAAGAATGELSLWTAAGGGKFSLLRKVALGSDVSQLWLSPGGERVAARTSQGFAVVECRSWATAKIPVNAAPLLVAFTTEAGLMTAVWPNEVWQWRPEQAKPERKVIEPEGLVIHSAASSSDGRTLAVATDRGVEVWRAEESRRTPPLEYDSQVRLAFSPDAQRLLCLKPMGGKHQIDVWRLTGGAPRFEQTVADLVGDAFAVSPDGATLATVAEDGTLIRLLGLREKRDEPLGKPSQFGEGASVRVEGLAFSSDGKRLASWTGRTVRIWSLESKSVAGQFEEPSGVQTARLAGSGEIFLGLGSDGTVSMHRLDAALRPVVHRTFDYTTSYGYSSVFKGLDITADGNLVAVAVAEKVVFIDAAKGRERSFQKVSPNLLRFSRDGSRLALVGDSETHLCDVTNGGLNEVKFAAAFDTPSQPDRYFHGMCNRKLTHWDPRTGRLAQQFDPQAVQTSGQGAISWDGTKFAFLARKENDNNAYGIEVFEVSSGRSITFVPLGVDSWHAIAFSPDDRRILVETCRSIESVDYRSGQITGRIDTASGPSDPDTNHSMAVSKNGWIATATVTGTVTLWRYDTGRAVQTLYNQKEMIERISLSECGNRLAYIQGKTVHLIDLPELVRSASR